MPSTPSEVWLPFEPKPLADGRPLHLILTFARELSILPTGPSDDRQLVLDTARKRAVADSAQSDAKTRQALVAAIWLLSDLVKQGWAVRVSNARIGIRRPVLTDDGISERPRIRAQLHVARNEQLREPPVHAFVRDLETRRLHNGRFVSIFSLMKDGSEFAPQLHGLREGEFTADEIIRPYLQFIHGDERCAFTGLKLAYIWRYFRHTWSNPYQSIPGRSMMILVRDGAAPFHPVIGIAAVSSAAVAIGPRDEALGWSLKAFVEALTTLRPKNAPKWVHREVDERIKRIYKVDLLQDEIFSTGELRKPSADTLKRLREEAASQRRKHYRFMRGGDYKRTAQAKTGPNWTAQAKTPLFRSKRAAELADLLAIRLSISSATKSGDDVAAIVATRSGAQALSTLLRKVKGEKVGSAIGELTVCGAIPPYSDALGGKLVAMLIASPEVRLEYRRRYGKSQSVIASSIAGRPVVKSAELVFVGTTSLFGHRPTQYDRISTPGVEAGDTVRYEYLGRTRGVGTFQFSERTVRELELLLAQSSEGVRINSVFGEGVNPRLRKIRQALDLLGLPANELLQHGTPRLVYGVRLARNVREYLLGIDRKPRYYLGDEDPPAATQRLAAWWCERWLAKRAQRKDVIERVEQHNLIHPIRHGARVPVLTDPIQPGLFQEW